ncbi:hypothetical protein Sjap_014721 [Stephania japonica]|uniref:Transmembrane protein n=1 Tax=Stephania japonica TaxID=461633 RepID=A0AAP0IHU6_9MAGN
MIKKKTTKAVYFSLHLSLSLSLSLSFSALSSIIQFLIFDPSIDRSINRSNLTIRSGIRVAMDESSTPFEHFDSLAASTKNKNNEWQTVSYAKSKRKQSAKPQQQQPSSDLSGPGNVFLAVEQQAEDRRNRRELAAEEQRQVAEAAEREIGGSSDGEVVGVVENGDLEKVKKAKKVKKPKISVAEAAAKIDAADLGAFLVDISSSFEAQQDIQLMRFADYFARAFSGVSASQFPWTKMFRESPVAKIADVFSTCFLFRSIDDSVTFLAMLCFVPLCHISEAVYKTSVDWINKKSTEALGSFVLWSLDSIFVDLANQLGGHKGSKRVAQQPSSKSQVAIFVVLAMVLRRKPDSLVSLLSILKDDAKYQGQDKLPVVIWAISQTCQGDLVVGMYLWVHFLLPMLDGKSCNPQSRDLILQLLERILSTPKAQPILLNGAVRKGERLVPPSALELLLRLTFPASSARVKATERFEAAYPTLKELALAGSSGSKAMKQVLQQLLTIAINAASENIPELSNEGTSLFIWCLRQSPDAYKQWDNIYRDNIEASVAVLRKLSNEWNTYSGTLSSVVVLRETVKSFIKKNEKALASQADAGNQASSIRDADKLCRVILGKSSRGNLCMKSLALAIVAAGVGAFVMSSNMDSWDLKKFSLMFTSQQFF